MSDISIEKLQEALLRDTAACIAEAEEGYRRRVDGVVRDLLGSGRRRVVLLAGPSSSGKTTTARILRDRLREAGHPAVTVSLDDFYRNADDPVYPRHPDGSRDYESPLALHAEQVHACLEAVLSGAPYAAPRYDFRAASRAAETVELRIPDGGFLIVEGLHALNPMFTDGLPREGLYGFFISVSTNLTDKTGARVLSGRKIRFLRRLSRDYLYRGADAARTYAMWQNVLDGEDRYLYPYRDRADSHLDTFHRYEVGVLRPYAERLLADPAALQGEYLHTVRQALLHFPPLPVSCVPSDSLLREFLPG